MATIRGDMSSIVTAHTGATVDVAQASELEKSVEVHISHQVCRQEDLLEIAAFLLLHAAKLRSKDA